MADHARPWCTPPRSNSGGEAERTGMVGCKLVALLVLLMLSIRPSRCSHLRVCRWIWPRDASYRVLAGPWLGFSSTTSQKHWSVSPCSGAGTMRSMPTDAIRPTTSHTQFASLHAYDSDVQFSCCGQSSMTTSVPACAKSAALMMSTYKTCELWLCQWQVSRGLPHRYAFATGMRQRKGGTGRTVTCQKVCPPST